MAKKSTTTKENPVEEKSIGITPEMEELKKQVENLKSVNEKLTESIKEWKYLQRNRSSLLSLTWS